MIDLSNRSNLQFCNSAAPLVLKRLIFIRNLFMLQFYNIFANAEIIPNLKIDFKFF